MASEREQALEAELNKVRAQRDALVDVFVEHEWPGTPVAAWRVMYENPRFLGEMDEKGDQLPDETRYSSREEAASALIAEAIEYKRWTDEVEEERCAGPIHDKPETEPGVEWRWPTDHHDVPGTSVLVWSIEPKYKGPVDRRWTVTRIGWYFHTHRTITTLACFDEIEEALRFGRSYASEREIELYFSPDLGSHRYKMPL